MSVDPATPALIRLHPSDNVATALRDLAVGAVLVAQPDGIAAPLPLSAPLALGHKAALSPIAEGALVIKHGHPIGRATAQIAAGEHVHVHNVISLSRESGVHERTAL